jgi:hypothetical protein
MQQWQQGRRVEEDETGTDDESGAWGEWEELTEKVCHTAEQTGHFIGAAIRQVWVEAHTLGTQEGEEAIHVVSAARRVARTDENPDLRMVMNSRQPDLAQKWLPPLRLDFNKHCDNGALIEVQRPGEDVKFTRWMFDFRVKRNKDGEIIRYKVRFNVRGDDEIRAGMFPDKSELYAPNVKACNLRHAVAHAAYYDLEMSLTDCVQACNTL